MEAVETTGLVDVRPRERSLTASQIGRLAALGVALWFAAMMIIRVIASLGMLHGGVGVVVFAAMVPLGWLSVRLSLRTASLRPSQAGHGVAIPAVSALACDAAVFAFGPSLYAAAVDDQLLVAGLLMWAVALSLAAGLVVAVRADRR